MWAFMSFMFFYVISQRASARRSCLCEACVLSDQGENFMLLSDGAL